MVKYSQTTEKKGSVEMKGIRAAVLALGGAFLLAGCGGESGVLAPIPAEGFSQGVYDALEENWTAWEAVDELERMLSSTLLGHCAQEFDSWAQCADFLGPSIPGPGGGLRLAGGGHLCGHAPGSLRRPAGEGRVVRHTGGARWSGSASSRAGGTEQSG